MCLSKHNPSNHQFIDGICIKCSIIHNRMTIRNAHFRNHIHHCTIDHVGHLGHPIRINIPVFNHEVCNSTKCQTCQWYIKNFTPTNNIMIASRIAKIAFDAENPQVYSLEPVQVIPNIHTGC
jgi:hypothetical protein